MPKRLSAKHVYVVASGDLRQSANEVCWPGQAAMEKQLGTAITRLGYKIVRGHPYKAALKHGFIASQKEGLEVFADLDPRAPLIVAEAVWQYSHHVLPGLVTHRGPILTLANWSGQWPGLVGMLNLNGSLTKAGVKYHTLWSEHFTDEFFLKRLGAWLKTGTFRHDVSHVKFYTQVCVPAKARAVAKRIASDLHRRKSIMGVFDEGCMGMYNAIVPDDLLFQCGVCKERLSQSALYYAATMVGHDEAVAIYDWYCSRGLKFIFGSDHNEDLTKEQVLWQCRTYVATCRMAEEFGC